MIKNGCVRTDNMSGTTLGKNLVSAKYMVGGTEAAIENGHVVLIKELLEGQREVREAGTPTKNSPLNEIALVASEEVIKEKAYNTLSEFINKAGDIIRCYRLVSHDIFAVSVEALDAEACAKGDYVELGEGTKLKVVQTPTEGATQVGRVIEVTADGWNTIEVA